MLFQLLLRIFTLFILSSGAHAFAQDPREVPIGGLPDKSISDSVSSAPNLRSQKNSAYAPNRKLNNYVFNKKLIDITSPESAVYRGNSSYEGYPGFRREEYYQPQNAGEILYADEMVIIAARTNSIVTAPKIVDRRWNRLEGIALAQLPLCYRGGPGAEFWVESKSWAGRNKSIPVHGMDLIAILNIPVDHKVSRQWLWTDFRKTLRKGVTDKFCGGRTQAVSVEFHIHNIQHNQKGVVQHIDNIDFPKAETFLHKLNATQESAYTAVRTATGDYSGDPFLSARFIFWDKIAPEYEADIHNETSVPVTSPNILRKNEKGAYIPRRTFYPAIGTYYDAFYPIWADEAGINEVVAASGPGGGLQAKFAESASYKQFLDGRKMVIQKIIEMRRAEEAAKYELAEVLVALGKAQGAMRCLPDMQFTGTVFEQDKMKWQAENCR